MDVVKISAGGDHTLALRNDGSIWAWGSNDAGKLGDGTTTNRHTPVRVQELTEITAVSGGGFHTVALRNDGNVWEWGLMGQRSSVGMSLDGTMSVWRSDGHTPVQVQELTGVATVSGGMFHTVALRRDGTVWAWGNNDKGQLGDGTTINRYTPIQVDML
jgi:alpha-tubulin suppressor-like RCC1 family protein